MTSFAQSLNSKKKPSVHPHPRPFPTYERDSLGRVLRPSCRHALATSLLRTAHQLAIASDGWDSYEAPSIAAMVRSSMSADGVPQGTFAQSALVYGGDSDGRYLHVVSSAVDSLVRGTLAALEDEKEARDAGARQMPSAPNAATIKSGAVACAKKNSKLEGLPEQREGAAPESVELEQRTECDLRYFRVLRWYAAYRGLYDGTAASSRSDNGLLLGRLQAVLRAMDAAEAKLWRQPATAAAAQSAPLHNSALRPLFALLSLPHGAQRDSGHGAGTRQKVEDETLDGLNLLIRFCADLSEATTDLPLAVLLSRLLLALGVVFFPGLHAEQMRALLVDPLVHRVCLLLEEQLVAAMSLGDEAETVLFLSGTNETRAALEQEGVAATQLSSRTRFVKMRAVVCRMLLEFFLLSLTTGVADAAVLFALLSESICRLATGGAMEDDPAPTSYSIRVPFRHTTASLNALLQSDDGLLIALPPSSSSTYGLQQAVFVALEGAASVHSGVFSITPRSFAQLLETLTIVMGVRPTGSEEMEDAADEEGARTKGRKENAVDYAQLLPTEFTPPSVAAGATSTTGEETEAAEEGEGEAVDSMQRRNGEEQHVEDPALTALNNILHSSVQFVAPLCSTAGRGQEAIEGQQATQRPGTASAVRFSFSEEQQQQQRHHPNSAEARPLSSSSTRSNASNGTLSGWDGRRPGSAASSGGTFHQRAVRRPFSAGSASAAAKSLTKGREKGGGRSVANAANSAALNFRALLPVHVQRHLSDPFDQTVELSRLFAAQQGAQGTAGKSPSTAASSSHQTTSSLTRQNLRDRVFMDEHEARHTPLEIRRYMSRYDRARCSAYNRIMLGETGDEDDGNIVGVGGGGYSRGAERKTKQRMERSTKGVAAVSSSPSSTSPLRSRTVSPSVPRPATASPSAGKVVSGRVLRGMPPRQRSHAQEEEEASSINEVHPRSGDASAQSLFFHSATTPERFFSRDDEVNVEGRGTRQDTTVPKLQPSRLSIAHEARSRDPGRLHRTRASFQTSQFRDRNSKTVSQRALSSDKYVQLLNCMRLSPETHAALPVSAKRLSLAPGGRSHRDLTPYFDLPTQWSKHHHPEWTSNEWKDYFNFVFFNDRVSEDDRRRLQAAYPQFQLPVRATGDLSETLKPWQQQ